jgi:hypothetical protein
MKKYRFLYLALACFIAIVVIFVFDGYLGVYDSATIKTGEFTQEITAGTWPSGIYPYSVSGQSNQKMFFTYRIDNRWFGAYRKTLGVSLWQQNQKIQDLYQPQAVEISPFGRTTVEWSVDPAVLNLEASRQEQFTIRIERDGTVREVIVSFYTPVTGTEIKPVPVPPVIR